MCQRANMVNSELENGDEVGHDFLMGLNRGSHSNFFRGDRNVTYKLTIFFSNKYKQNTFYKNLKTISSISFTRVSDYALFHSCGSRIHQTSGLLKGGCTTICFDTSKKRNPPVNENNFDLRGGW